MLPTIKKMNNNDKITLLIIRGVISQLPQKNQEKIKELHQKLSEIIDSDKENGLMALSLLGTERAAEVEAK